MASDWMQPADLIRRIRELVKFPPITDPESRTFQKWIED